MRVLVTGGAGFIGSHTVERFAAEGSEVTVIDDLSSGDSRYLPASVRLLKVDVREALPLLDGERFDAIVHLAAVPSVQVSLEKPLETHNINYVSTLQLLEFARHTGIKRFLFASSAAVYGASQSLPLEETTLAHPISPYGVDKLSSENILRVYRNLYGIEGCAARFFNVYGPRQNPASPYSGVISIFLDAFQSQGEVNIFGDGTQTRDFISVHDVVSAIYGLVTSHEEPPTVSNVCTGTPTSLNQVLEVMSEVFARKPRVSFHDRRAGDIRHSIGSNSILRRALPNWEPAEFSAGIRTLIG